MMKFESYFDWLCESELEEKPNYGCVMLFANIANWDKHLALIDIEDIYSVPGKALENHPHVTLAYGLFLNKIKPLQIKNIMKRFFPIKVSIKKITCFNNSEYDVVKYDVPATKELKTWREELLRLPNYQEFPTYKPHITIGYTNSGTGIKYIKELEKPFHVIFNRAEYSYTDNEKDNIVVQLDRI
jgi:hypothetical protein